MLINKYIIINSNVLKMILDIILINKLIVLIINKKYIYLILKQVNLLIHLYNLYHIVKIKL